MFFFPIPKLANVSHIELPTYITGNNVFAPQEMDRINQIAAAIEPRKVTVGHDKAERPEYNRSVFRHLIPGPDTHWIYQRIAQTVAMLNATCYQFDVDGFDEPLYHVTYDASEQGHYTWHYDGNAAGKPTRKLSITFQMSPETDYVGGDLEFNRSGEPMQAPRQQGTFVMFPSYLLHRVTPVTKGTRVALVGWCVGPAFR